MRSGLDTVREVNYRSGYILLCAHNLVWSDQTISVGFYNLLSTLLNTAQILALLRRAIVGL